MKVWYHARCMFETLQRARATTKKIETPADLEGFGELEDGEKEDIKQYIKGIYYMSIILIIWIIYLYMNRNTNN